ncbi:hypothetical protein ES702_07263 [subsurface metagenome]
MMRVLPAETVSGLCCCMSIVEISNFEYMNTYFLTLDLLKNYANNYLVLGKSRRLK